MFGSMACWTTFAFCNAESVCQAPRRVRRCLVLQRSNFHDIQVFDPTVILISSEDKTIMQTIVVMFIVHTSWNAEAVHLDASARQLTPKSKRQGIFSRRYLDI